MELHQNMKWWLFKKTNCNKLTIENKMGKCKNMEQTLRWNNENWIREIKKTTKKHIDPHAKVYKGIFVMFCTNLEIGGRN